MLQRADRLGPAGAAELVFLSEPVSAEQLYAWKRRQSVLDDAALDMSSSVVKSSRFKAMPVQDPALVHSRYTGSIPQRDAIELAQFKCATSLPAVILATTRPPRAREHDKRSDALPALASAVSASRGKSTTPYDAG
jgi:hypothetical protein